MNALLVDLPKLVPAFEALCAKYFAECHCLTAQTREALEANLTAGIVDYVVIPYQQNDPVLALRSAEWIDCALSYKCPTIVLASRLTSEVRNIFATKSILNYLLNQEDEPQETVQQLVELIQRHRHNHKFFALVVDDSAAYRAQVSYFLRVHGLTVMTAKDGQEALEIIQQHPIRLVVTDYHMPNMDGLTLTKILRRTKGKDEIAVIAITATDGCNGATEFLKVGANDFLVKPYSREELICRVDQNLDIILLLDKMRERANRDFLTQLYNRRYFLKTAEKRYQLCLAEQVPMVMAMLDIDYFKKINDTYGHEAGDEALRQMATILSELVPEDQLVARLGGEEFAILFTGECALNAAGWFERLRQVVAAHVIRPFTQVEFYQTISIGWVSCKEMPESLIRAMMFADKALYRAKHQGRNCVVRAEVYGLDADDD